MVKISKAELAKLKNQGIMNQKQEGYFTVRIVNGGGNFTGEQLRILADFSEKYGKGYLGLTTRQAAEIPWIKYEDLEAIKEDITNHGMKHGGHGKKVRAVVACKGGVCPHGLYDTQKYAEELHNKYFGIDLPYKCKISLTGCPNNCVGADTTDIGFMGQAYVKYDVDKCKNCGLCTRECKQKSVKLIDKKLVWDKNLCVNCGKCAVACPFGAMTIEKEGLAIYIGGKRGRSNYRFGNRLSKLYKEEDIDNITQAIFKAFKELGNEGERIALLVERIGIEAFENKVFEYYDEIKK